TRTQILVAAVDAVGIGVGAAFFVPGLAVPLGILVFVGSFIPIVGAIVTGSIAVLVVLVAQGWVQALVMLGIVLLVQQIEGHILQPFLMGHAVSLHPVAVLLVVAAGSFAAGIVGALFAVPLAAVLNTVVLYLHGHDKFPELGTEDRIVVRGSPQPPVVARAEADLQVAGSGSSCGGARNPRRSRAPKPTCRSRACAVAGHAASGRPSRTLPSPGPRTRARRTTRREARGDPGGRARHARRRPRRGPPARRRRVPHPGPDDPRDQRGGRRPRAAQVREPAARGVV